MSIPRKLSLVKLKDGWEKDFPVKSNWFYFLGEIPNMPGHCIIVDDKGKVHCGFHTERFEENYE
jgi:hypothetical protein